MKRASTQKIEKGESDLDRLEPIGQRGSFAWIRPEHMEPKGTKPISEVLALMHQQRAECLQMLERMKNGEGLLYHARMSVNDSGRLDLYQWLYFVAQHAERHIAQMEINLAEQQHRP